jgi:hypothetical protein
MNYQEKKFLGGTISLLSEKMTVPLQGADQGLGRFDGIRNNLLFVADLGREFYPAFNKNTAAPCDFPAFRIIENRISKKMGGRGSGDFADCLDGTARNRPYYDNTEMYGQHVHFLHQGIDRKKCCIVERQEIDGAVKRVRRMKKILFDGHRYISPASADLRARASQLHYRRGMHHIFELPVMIIHQHGLRITVVLGKKMYAHGSIIKHRAQQGL